MSEPKAETRRLIPAVASLVVVAVCAFLFVYGGMPALVLFLAACALSLTIFCLWSSLQGVDRTEEMDFEEALSLAAPSATEEQKRAILRTLKDLEYELSVGKISQEDFDQVSAEYRAEAKRLIYLADEELKVRMEKAEQVVQQRLARESTAKKKSRKARPNAEAQATDTSSKDTAPDPGTHQHERLEDDAESDTSSPGTTQSVSSTQNERLEDDAESEPSSSREARQVSGGDPQ